MYSSAIFYTRAQAFNRTTLVLRQDLPDEGIGDFDFVTSPDSVSEVTKIINSEIVNKGSIIFTIAITVNFVKVDMDGAISIKVSPCFRSKERYINNVSNYSVKDTLLAMVLEIIQRFDDFVEKGSGWSLHSFRYYDLHITQLNDLRGGCCDLSIDPERFLSRATGLVNILNNDSQCLLYCIAAAFTNKSKWSNIEKSAPEKYVDFVRHIKTSNATQQIGFPTPLSEIHDLECMNRKGTHPISFRVNVFREDPITKKLQPLRKSAFEDGKLSIYC